MNKLKYLFLLLRKGIKDYKECTQRRFCEGRFPRCFKFRKKTDSFKNVGGENIKYD